MKIKGIEGMTEADIKSEIDKGARFVIFQYCISVLVMSFKRNSDIYFLRAGESAAGKSAGWCALSLALGWWGIPWGPIWTIATVGKNLGGGIDVTNDVLRPQKQAVP
jgi:hypothetical protein